jgi:hypothetical protein
MGDNIARLIELQDSGKNTDTTEDAMALTFAEQHADHLRFCAAWGRWFNYDGACWTHDATFARFRPCARNMPRGSGHVPQTTQCGYISKNRGSYRTAGQE